ncbi:hypothetical protein FRB99_008077 [Tulasnella sp. 403]|nr:hypothetical protein FRB99_008077 [Tulasnella sp. 403]
MEALHSNSSERERDERYVRRHRSLGVGAGPQNASSKDRDRERERAREKRRGESVVALGLGNPTTATSGAPVMATSRSAGSVATGNSRDRHNRHMSTSASASLAESTNSNSPSHHGTAGSRRIHTVHTDTAHLPPSPSSAYQHLLRPAPGPVTPPLPNHHASPSVGHALLRGNQEGWAGLDDSTTAEALRRLDGVASSKVRNRMSTRSGGSSAGSRPPTPGQKQPSSSHWDGQEHPKKSRASVGSKEHLARASNSSLKLDSNEGASRSAATVSSNVSEIGDLVLSGGDESSWAPAPVSAATVAQHAQAHGHTPHRKSVNGKDGMPTPGSQRSSYGVVPKRGSASSASFTGTPTSGSRDSTTLSSTTSNTSISLSQRHSYGKMRRNSAGSDASSVHSGDAAIHQRDRAAALAGSYDIDDDALNRIPPVPPLPKDLSNYRSPLPSSTAMTFPSSASHAHTPSYHSEDADRTVVIPSLDIPPSPPKQHHPPHQSTTPGKAPSKKWSFSGLSLHLPGSGSSKDSRHIGSASSPTGGVSPRSSRSISSAAQPQDKAEHNHVNEYGSYAYHEVPSSQNSIGPWSPAVASPEIPGSRDSYFPSPGPHMSANSSRSPERTSLQARTPEMRSAHSRTETASSASTHTHSTAAPPPPSKTPLSPKRSSTAKRLTPSAIPFFRRSSSQSMQASSSSQPKSSGESSSSPTRRGGVSHHASNSSVSTSGSNPDATISPSATKKSSMLSLLKGSSSRRSVHVEKPSELKPKEKKDDKDRSESRISVLMGRKRGKTLSATDPKKSKDPVPLPPMQITSLPSSTAQRVASLKPASTLMTPTKSAIARAAPSPASQLSKASDASLRTSRQQLPTIAGSPSVGPVGGPSSSQVTPMASHTSLQSTSTAILNNSIREKDTPTKIPRISGRTSTTSSPQSTYRGGPSITGNSRRTSLNNSSMSNVSSNNTEVPPSPQASFVSDFGVLEPSEVLGDEEMMMYIKRTQARRLANGARQEELDEMLKFPDPTPPVPPSSPSAILKSSQAVYLSDYERKEILDFPQVYCIGARSEKKPATRDNPANNYGYDDERGDYLVVTHDHLAYRYEVMGTLGKGSFGQVLNCRDHATGASVAIKIIRNKKRFHHQALVEIKILDSLRKWDHDEKHHVIKMNEHFYFRNHLCIAMELLSINLYELIKANGFVGFTTTLIRRFTSQMLASLALMRHHRIVHCDLKPENVLLRRPDKSAIKVIDFGSSCFEHEKVYTYIQSRFYRSPEVILGMNYHMAIDMWSLGCILAELYTGFPIFPGENEQEQLSCIMEVLGVPDKDLINRSSRKKLFFDSTGAPRPVVNSKGRRRKPGTKTLAQVLRCDDEAFVDFIAKCLVWDPERRLKPAPAMRHGFLTAGRKPKAPALSAAASATRSFLTSSSVGSRSSKIQAPQETPRKSLIGAPTPLTARVSSRAPTTTGVPSTPIATPNNHTPATTTATHRSYRTTQANSVSYHSPRSLAGASGSYVATKTS